MIRRFLLLLAVALLAVACGDDDDTSADAADQTPTDQADDAGTDDDADPDAGDQAGDEPDEAPDDTDDGSAGFIAFTALGVDTDERVVEFGEPADDVVGLVSSYLGEPTADTGDQATDLGCPADAATYRFVEWGDTLITFLDGAFASWFVTDPDQNVLSFIGDSTEVSIRAGSTTVAELESSFGSAVSVADEPPLGPSFYVTDNWGDLYGEVSGLDQEDLVQGINGGIGCGE